MNYPEFKSTSFHSANGRREFLKTSLIGVTSLFYLPLTSNTLFYGHSKLNYDLYLDIPTRYFDGKNCFVHPRAGIVPGAGKDGLPRVVMTMNTQDLSGSDVYKATYGMQTDDLGKTWTTPGKLNNLAPRCEIIDEESRPVALSDFWPTWHKTSQLLLGTGCTHIYTSEWKVTDVRHTSYSVYDAEKENWSNWKKLKVPGENKFLDFAAGCTQRLDLEDGTILLPVYSSLKNSIVAVIRCYFDGKTLNYLEHGTELSIDDDTRGLHEPSLTFFEGEYFMTIRNDRLGFVSRSSDGLNFSPLQQWKFDDGSDLGNYNTQQHWVTHNEGMFLVYTRRGAGNDHVFRHRAPLFIAQVDSKSLRVIRATERILVPERGARLGNFGITDVSSDETWVTVSEWMQPRGVEKYGSDGSVFVARIHWDRPNRLFRV